MLIDIKVEADRAKISAGWTQMKKGSVIKNYLADNPGEIKKIDNYVVSISRGETPAPPTVASAFGQGLVKILSAGF